MLQTLEAENIWKLGFGYMRLPRKGGAFDMEQINRMADAFIQSGGMYFDTAYVYDGAEVALGKSVIRRHPRDKVKIATKLNLRFANSHEQIETQFNTSLERLGTDYVDFYLLHGINAGMLKKVEDLGAWDYQRELKEKGLVRYAGFSFHSTPEDLEMILNAHPEADFVQLQINYLDWDNPKVQSRRLYEIARAHHKPIIVMEPVKGGKLASGDSPVAQLMRKADPDASLASWALRFTAQLDGVLVTLSGMSSLGQALDNIKTFSDLKPLTNDELGIIKKAVEAFNAVPRIACTGCNYCVDGCPSNIMIPRVIEIYNDYLIHNTTTNLSHSYAFCTTRSGKGIAGDCVGCRACEEACPQKLEIVDTLAKTSALLD